MPGVGSPIVASCLARPLSAPPFAVSSLDVIAASPIQPCRCPWNASSWTEPARRPKSIVCPGAQFRKNLWPLRNHRLELGFWGCRKSFRNWAPGDGQNVGGYNAPGLPALAGSFRGIYSLGGEEDDTYTGSFVSGAAGKIYWSSTAGTGLVDCRVNFSASKSTSIYGASATVVPPSINQSAILYLGRPSQV